MASPATAREAASAVLSVSLRGLPIVLTDYQISDELFQPMCVLGTILDLLACSIPFSLFSGFYI